jgi:DNA-binding NarL/FixJ family response regulator
MELLMNNNISIYIADGHNAVREGLKLLLDTFSNIEVIGEANNGADAKSEILSLMPNIAFIDIGLPSKNGLKVTREILKQEAKLKIIILSMHFSDEYVLEAIQAGASGYIIKQSVAEILVQAIQTVMSGNFYISPDISSKVLKDAQQKFHKWI